MWYTDLLSNSASQSPPIFFCHLPLQLSLNTPSFRTSHLSVRSSTTLIILSSFPFFYLSLAGGTPPCPDSLLFFYLFSQMSILSSTSAQPIHSFSFLSLSFSTFLSLSLSLVLTRAAKSRTVPRRYVFKYKPRKERQWGNRLNSIRLADPKF